MFELKIKEDGVMIGAWLNGGKRNVVLAPGIPQYLDKYHPFVKQIAGLGYNLFVPRYRGTYESDDPFSTMNSKESLEIALKIAKRGSAIELFENKKVVWDTERTVLVGFSYGALPALLQQEEVDKTVLVCPAVSLRYHTPESGGENIAETFNFLERAYQNVYRFKAVDVIADLTNIALPERKDNLSIVVGRADSSIPSEEIGLLKSMYHPQCFEKEGGHSIIMTDDLLQKVLEA